jgi:hypothetical protein
MRRVVAGVATLAVLVLAGAAEAHVGSPDAVADGQAGPYHLLVTIRPPEVIPGIAQIEVRALDDDVARVSVVPLPLQGPGVKLAPVPDRARASADDPRRFDDTLWLMQTGAWQIRVTADGVRGSGTLAIPIPALARTVRPMPRYLGALLVALMALIVAGAIAIVGAGLRESDLAPGAAPDRRRVARGRTAMAVTAAILALAILGGRRWWNFKAGFYGKLIYKPMHVVRAPAMDAIAHLHPRRSVAGVFTQAVPPLPAGTYRLFGDIVHQTGLDETVTTALDLGASNREALELPGDRFDADDAMAIVPSAGTVAAPVYTFPDGRGELRWVSPRTPHAGETIVLEFEAEGADGRQAPGLEPYMGMAGHAMIVAHDFSVFAHVHPTGSVPMAALGLVDSGAPIDHSRHHGMVFGPLVRFPYVFPHAGDYRLFVQIKVEGRVKTAAFDLVVAPPLSRPPA